jgi:predicted RNA-binding Zn-ribbon protein involved in translation (DUF1610 family)
MSTSKDPQSDETPFRCMNCKNLVTTDTGDWPNDCPHCGDAEWMTTMKALDDGVEELRNNEESKATKNRLA